MIAVKRVDEAQYRYLVATDLSWRTLAEQLAGHRVLQQQRGVHHDVQDGGGKPGVVVAQGKRAILIADGTNVVRVTPDT